MADPTHAARSGGKHQRTIFYVGAGALILFLLYRYYQGSQANAQGTQSDQSGASAQDASQYAALAGQEQSDMAAIQAQNQELAGQEQSDVQQIQANEGGLTAFIQGLGADLSALDVRLATLEHPATVPSQATGTTPVTRTKTASPGASKALAAAIAKRLKTSEGLSGDAAKSFLAALKKQGFAKQKGTGGTYIKSGQAKYFTFEQNGVLHIRESSEIWKPSTAMDGGKKPKGKKDTGKDKGGDR